MSRHARFAIFVLAAVIVGGLPPADGLMGPANRGVALADEPKPAAKGKPKRKFIVGGEEVDGRKWPWQVLLGIGRKSGDGLSITKECGGSLIGSRWALTAAHCVDPTMMSDGDELFVYVGSNVLGEGRRIAVMDGGIHIHEGWRGYLDGSQMDNDVALLHLSEDAIEPTDGGKVGLVTIADAATERAMAPGGTPSIVTGWGAFDVEKEGERSIVREMAKRLRQVRLKIKAHETCRGNYESFYEKIQIDGTKVTENMICAGVDEGGKDSCSGDSGGPLFVPRIGEGGHVQVGIVSWGADCGEKGLYGVYTRISRYHSWITARMR